MAIDLTCACGTHVQLTNEEARDLTWCPNCRTVLVLPERYGGPGTAPWQRTPADSLRTPQRRTATAGSGSINAGWLVPVAVIAGLVLTRVACMSTSSYKPATYRTPQFQQAPVVIPENRPAPFQPPQNPPGFQQPGNLPGMRNPNDPLVIPPRPPDFPQPGNLPGMRRPGDPFVVPPKPPGFQPPGHNPGMRRPGDPIIVPRPGEPPGGNRPGQPPGRIK